MVHLEKDGGEIRDRVYDHAIAIAQENIDFAHRFASAPALQGSERMPWYHQLRRLRAIVTAPRALLADETGLGKTAVAVLAKLFGDLEESFRSDLLNGGRTARARTPVFGDRKLAIVFATVSGMRDPWDEVGVNTYVPEAFPRQRVLHLRSRCELEALVTHPRRAPDVDFLVVNYEKLLVPAYVRALVQLIRSGVVSLIALDECHQLRNPKTNRFSFLDGDNGTSGFVALLSALRRTRNAPKLLMLSATPIANLPADLGVLIHLLNPSQDIRSIRTVRSATVMRDLFWQECTFRLDKEMAKEMLGLPDITEERIDIPINESDARVYTSSWERLVTIGGKIQSLARALFPAKFRLLEKRVPKWLRDGKQVIIFSTFKSDVTRELATRLGGAWIDGEVSVVKREEIARAFRAGDIRVLIATTHTMAESVSLVTGNRPCVVVRFEPFFTPYEWVQTVGRVWRPGQHGAVSVYTLVAGGPVLAAQLRAARQRIERRYFVSAHKTWRPTSYDEDAYDITEVKLRAGAKVYAGHEPTSLERRLSSVVDARGFHHAMPSIKFSSPSHRACFTARLWIGRGLDFFRNNIGTPSFAQFIKDYNRLWGYSTSAHTWELIRQIIEEYEAQTEPLTQIVDQGAGPGCGIRALKRSMTAVDLSPKMLAVAQREVRQLNRREQLGVQLRTVERPIQACGLRDASAQLAVASYVLQYAQQPREPNETVPREIEDIILESNRILRENGLWIVALPYNLREELVRRFERVVASYGFEILPLSGFYKPTLAEDRTGRRYKPIGSFQGVWLTVARKRETVHSLAKIAPVGLTFKPIALSGGITQRGKLRERQLHKREPERVVQFRHHRGKKSTSGQSIQTLIAKSVRRSAIRRKRVESK
ncbi:MAG: helicase-related protein [bacterium]|nr:helicase-related protein [bacterium]